MSDPTSPATPDTGPVPGLSRRPIVILGLTALLLGGGALGLFGWMKAQRSLGAEVARLAAPGDIRMIASQDCSICHVVRLWFAEHAIAYGECLIERDARCRAEFNALGAEGTPVLLVRGQPVMGFDPQRVRALLRPPA